MNDLLLNNISLVLAIEEYPGIVSYAKSHEYTLEQAVVVRDQAIKLLGDFAALGLDINTLKVLAE
jgi:predicted transcriptional regulator